MIQWTLLLAMLFTASPDAGMTADRPCGKPVEVPVDTTLDVRGRWPKALLKQVRVTPPVYPQLPNGGRVPGEVRAAFVIDTLGQVVPGSGRILWETARDFGDAVCAVLYQAAFEPVVLNGRKQVVLVKNQITSFHR